MTGADVKERLGKGAIVAVLAAMVGASASNVFGFLGWGAQHLREADLADTATAVRLDRIEAQMGQIASDESQQAIEAAAIDARLGEIIGGVRDMRTDLARRTEVLLALRSLAEETRTVVQTLDRQTCTQRQCDRLEEAVHVSRRR